ncbi:MAG: hypothetical protein HY791_29945 [Deltaproteobacteria bacterium]|nr:hypothetical protein [Deltaproteobacteria bacterium]
MSSNKPRRRSFCTSLSILGLAASCSLPARLEISESIQYVAVLDVDDQGRVTKSSGIASYVPGVVIASASDESRILGWTSDQLGSAGVTESTPLTDPLTEAAGCEQSLPTPLVALAWTSDGLRDVVAPRVTAAWVRQVCPELLPERLSFRFDCFEEACQPKVTRRERCGFDVRFACPELTSELDARVGFDGRVCLNLGSAGWDCSGRDPAGSVMSLRCASPSCEVSADLRPTEPPFVVAETSIHDSNLDPFDPPDSMLLPPSAREMGYAYDFAVLEDRVVVSASDGSAVVSCNGNPGHLELFDAETLDRRVVPAPSCLTRLLRDSYSDGFLGLFTRGSTLAIARFDPEGRLVDGSERTVVSIDPTTCLETAALEESGDTVVVGLRLGEGDDCQEIRSIMVRYRGERLELVDVTAAQPGEALRAAATSSERELVLGFDGPSAGRISWWDVENGAENSLTLEPSGFRDGNSVTDVVAVVGGRVLISVARQRPSVSVAVPSELVHEEVAFFEEPGNPTSAHPWVGAQFMVLGTRRKSQTEWPAFVTLFDTSTGRFLPGSWPLGRGPGRIRSDRKGRLWILYPWESKLRRLTR